MRLAFILDPLANIKIDKDSSYVMMREAASRQHTIYTLQQSDLAWKNQQVIGFARSLTLINSPDHTHCWYAEGATEVIPLNQFDAVLMRKDPPFDTEYLYSTYLLEQAEHQGAYVINSPRAIRDYNEKLATIEFPEFIPPSLITSQAQPLLEFLAEHEDIILKPLDGMGGASIFRVQTTDHNINVIIETLTRYGTRTIMAQRFLPEIRDGDKRILLIDGKPVGYALARIPKPGETRGNLAAGGTGKAQPLSARDSAISKALGKILPKRGLFLVGLDIIGDYLTEINVTSPTGMQEITNQTGVNVAGLMIDALEKNCSAR
ncbi:glutathione synthetase [Nitrosomonas stercoris]|uniref:Glutathione synthetase n=1 Tax=Nitrosomonas stercoris TaxID=1444684 RepID=A0A4Y1YR25_9PROT|nr:glutathione synthetase [Nitrosomonas stercoris]